MAEDKSQAPAPGQQAGSPTGQPSASPNPMAGMPAGNAMPPQAMAMMNQQMGGQMPPEMMLPPHVAAMMPRPYPNPQQMFQPVGLAYVMRMQEMEQGMPAQQQNKKQKS